MDILCERRRRLRFSTHANQRLSERGILRRWVVAATTTRPTCFGRHQIYVLSADELQRRFGATSERGLRVVVDRTRGVVVTVHWHAEDRQLGGVVTDVAMLEGLMCRRVIAGVRRARAPELRCGRPRRETADKALVAAKAQLDQGWSWSWRAVAEATGIPKDTLRRGIAGQASQKGGAGEGG